MRASVQCGKWGIIPGRQPSAREGHCRVNGSSARMRAAAQGAKPVTCVHRRVVAASGATRALTATRRARASTTRDRVWRVNGGVHFQIYQLAILWKCFLIKTSFVPPFFLLVVK